jgi:hypothetical protein
MERQCVTPEEAATRLLASAQLAGRPSVPIDVTFLAEEVEGLDVQEHSDLRTLPDGPRPLGEARLSGLMLPASRRIWVDAIEATRSDGRRRFTIAHELGHWRMHADGADAHARFCRTDDIGASAAELLHTQRMEREANRFAAALLMPEAMLRDAAVSARLSVPHLAKRFGVSARAMQVRLQSLNLLPGYMHR